MKGLTVEPIVPKAQRGKRVASHACMARIITALLVCGKMNLTTLKNKADVTSYRTIIRVLHTLEHEGLVKITLDIDNQHIKYYEWIGRNELQ